MQRRQRRRTPRMSIYFFSFFPSLYVVLFMLHVAGHCWPLGRWGILQAALINIGNIVVIAASTRALPWLSRRALRQAVWRGDLRPTAILPLLLPLNGHVNI